VRSAPGSLTGERPETVTVHPTEIDDVLYNPGMGLADFHFSFGSPLPSGMYPRATVAYFRWTWSELEPAEGRYNFALIDNVIREATARGETLAFRIMSVYGEGTPRWLLDKGVETIRAGGDLFPDHNDPVFLEYHEQLLRALGQRYAGRPEIDHVDIGSVGCWGEWNVACCGAATKACRRFFPTALHKRLITDWYFRYFPKTPLVMLAGGPTEYAASKGAGWRGDCFGDYRYFRPTWSHMVNVYERIARNPVVRDAWKTAPVEFEVCGDMQEWYDRGFDIDRILQQGLRWHVSVLNAKSSPVPAPWRAKVFAFLKKVGYRLVLREISHEAEVRPGGLLTVRSDWENRGVAPIYHPWPLAYRLRSPDDHVVAQWTSGADLERWLPGGHEANDTVRVPEDAPPGRYSLDVGILDESGSTPIVEIAIVGKRADKWYPVSIITLKKRS